MNSVSRGVRAEAVSKLLVQAGPINVGLDPQEAISQHMCWR